MGDENKTGKVVSRNFNFGEFGFYLPNFLRPDNILGRKSRWVMITVIKFVMFLLGLASFVGICIYGLFALILQGTRDKSSSAGH